MSPDGDHKTYSETQADEYKSRSIHDAVCRGLSSSLGTGECKPEKHGGTDEFAEHGKEMASQSNPGPSFLFFFTVPSLLFIAVSSLLFWLVAIEWLVANTRVSGISVA